LSMPSPGSTAIAISGITAMTSVSQYLFMIPISRRASPHFSPRQAFP
jgi:hypothetical protein